MKNNFLFSTILHIFALMTIQQQIDSLNYKGNLSDGYHTFDELYEHRIVLYISLCRILAYSDYSGNWHFEENPVWRSKVQSDGREWEEWFLLGIGKQKGYQITYHLPISKWIETEFAITLEKAPDFDGHSSADVLKRIKTL